LNESASIFKCVQKPTKRQLSLTHHVNKSAVEQNKNFTKSKSP